jgi:hypothetical protein
MKQSFFWAAILDDNSVVTEFKPSGEENSYKDLPRDKIQFFGLTSSTEEYFFNLKNGKLLVKGINSPEIDIKIPLRKEKFPISITGNLPPFTRYNFFQYKEAHQDFNLGLQTSGNVIDKHVFGWKQWKYLKVLGKVFIEVGLVIHPNDFSKKPLLKIIIRSREDGNAIAGSPYEMKF